MLRQMVFGPGRLGPYGTAGSGAAILNSVTSGPGNARKGHWCELESGRAMNTKQKTVIGCGLAVVIAMAAYPPWATWCIPVDDRDVQIQYGWLFGRVNYPECAEKLPWVWGLATDRLLLQVALVILATVALTVAFHPKDTG